VGSVLSVDRLISRLRFVQKRKKFVSFQALRGRSRFASWPLLLIQCMFALIYFSATKHKLLTGGIDWVNGFTMQYYLIQDGLRWGKELGVFLGQHHILCVILSWFTIIFEGTFFLVLFFPALAILYVLLGFALHMGIYITMNAPFFQYLTIYIVFLPWIRWPKGLVRMFTPKPMMRKLELLFDGQCPFCIRSMTVLRYFDWFDRLQFSELQNHWQRISSRHPEVSFEECLKEMVLIDRDDIVHKGFFAFRRILWSLPVFWPLLAVFYFPFASTVGPKVYRFVASRRLRFQACESSTCSTHFTGNRKGVWLQ